MEAPGRIVVKGLARTEQILVTDEEMQRLYLDGKPVRRYCLHCRGPKLMIPSKEKAPHQLSLTYMMGIPAKLAIFCKTCGTKYLAKLNAR